MKKKLIISIVLCAVVLTLVFSMNALAQSPDKINMSFTEDSGDYTRTVSLKQADTDEEFTFSFHTEYGWLSADEDGSFTYELDAENADVISAREKGRTLSETVTARFEDENDVKRVCNIEFIIQPENRDVRVGRYAVLNDGKQAVVEGRFFKEVKAGTGKDEPELLAIFCPFGEYEIDDGDEFSYTLNNWQRAVQALSKGEVSKKALLLRLTGSKGTVKEQSIEISVTGVNDTPTVKSYTYNLTNDQTAVITGNLLTDSTLGDGYTYQHSLKWDNASASYGTMVKGADGSYTYTFDPTCNAAASLTEGQTLTETFTYTYKDKDGSKADGSLSVTIGWVDLTPAVHSYEHTLTEDAALDGDDPIYTYSIENVLSTAVLGNGSAKQHSFKWLDEAKTDYGTVTLGKYGSFSFTLYSNLTIVQALYPENGDVEQCYRYTYTDADGDVAYGQVMITICGDNDAPDAQDVFSSVTEDGILTASGNVRDACALGDGTRQQHTVDWEETAVKYGTFCSMPDGSYLYELNNDLPAVQALGVDDVLEEVLSFTVYDVNNAGNTATLTITINGTDDVPAVKSVEYSLYLDDYVGFSGSALDGSTLGDGAASWHTFMWDNTTVRYGKLSTDLSGHFSYVIDRNNESVQTLGKNDTLKDINITFTYTDIDGDFAKGYYTFVICYSDITPVVKNYSHLFTEDEGSGNDDPIYTYEIANVLADSILGNGTKAQHSFAWESAATSQYGNVTLGADGSFRFILDNASKAVQALYSEENVPQETFNYSYTDLDGSKATGKVVISFAGLNDAPVIQSFTHSLYKNGSETTVSGNALTGAYDVDAGQTLTFAWTSAPVSNYGTVTLNADGSYKFVLNNSLRAVQALGAGESFLEVYNYTYNDEAGSIANGKVMITIIGIDDKPVAVS